MKMKLKGTNKCGECGVEYERGFYGTGFVYCSKACRLLGYKSKQRNRNRRKYEVKDKNCLICERNILKLGLRKFANKYCSKRCMNLAQQIKRGRKYCTIKIPLKDIPILFNLDIQPKLAGK